MCIYGGTAAGVTAALQAARLNLSVIVIEPGNHVGGVTTSGLGCTDFGNKETVGGLAREFYQRIGRHYGTPAAWHFEPHVADSLFKQWLIDADVPVLYREYLAGVQ